MTTLDFTAIGRDRGASRMFQNIGREADTASKKMGGVNRSSKMVGGGFKFAAAGAAAVGTGLLAAAGAAVGYGLKIAAGNEQAKIGFTTMLGSGKKAEVFLKDLEAFAAKTPFEFPELQKAASSLISVGVNSKNVIPIMKTLGNVTSGMGTGAEGVQRATVALQQMQSAGRITAEDLNQLRDAGIPLKTVMAAISAETGTSSKKLFEMSRNGKLGKKELDALMASLASGKGFERFNGLMDAQSKSLTGMLSTLKDTFGMGLAKAIEPALPFLKGAIGSVTKHLGDFFAWTATHQEDIVIGLIDTGNAVLGVAKTFFTLESSALKALAGIADGIATILEGMDRMALGDQFSGTVGALRGFAKGARDAGAVIDNDLVPSIDEAHKQWNAFGKDQRTKAALRDANQVITNAVGRTTDSLKKNGKTVDDNSEKGRRNRAALKNLASAHVAYRDKLIATGAKTKDVDRATDSARSSFIKTAIKMGANRREAERLADKYGLLDRKINNLNDKKVTARVAFTAGGRRLILKPGTLGGGVTAFAGGGYTGNHSPSSVAGLVHGDEHVIKSGSRRKFESRYPGYLKHINEHGTMPGYRVGGVVNPRLLYNPVSAAAVANAVRLVMDRGVGLIRKHAGDNLEGLDLLGGGGIGGPVGSVGSFRGGRFTQLAIKNLRKAEQIAGVRMRVFQGGWRPRTSYSGTSHAGDAVDTQASRALIRAIRAVGWASGDRTGLGNWMSHAHSVPGPSRGRARGSAIWQYQDYVRRGGARQSLRSPWGLSTGGVMTKRGLIEMGEQGPERILSTNQNRSFEQLVKVITANRASVGGSTYIINAPNYVGDKKDLVKALTDLDRQGRLAVVKR